MHLWLIPFFPLLGFLVNGLWGNRLTRTTINVVAIGSVALSFVWVTYCLAALMPLTVAHSEHVFTWLQSGALQVGCDFSIDRLTAVMLLIITGVGLLIHTYAIGYMSREPGYSRFFGYLNLFMFFMLVLVLARNLLVLFVGWEGVGLCSYLLIGFNYLDQVANDAGKKAFIVNRIGDFGFLLGILLVFSVFRTLDFDELSRLLSAQAAGMSAGVLNTIAILLLIGATGKSAQVPLYVWLPDAMAGPTPVSALIHAATMVTAGVYMIARASFLYVNAPLALNIVAVIGLVTAVLAASIGLVQNDIKRVFAYSTVSQLGYMFLGLGVGAFSASIFHVMTHAFFKALLFLGAGSVIHALSGQQDLRHMGGLARKMPVTCLTMLCACLAISGIPPFSGAFSKDAILAATYQHSPVLYWVGVATAAMTAFYVFRAFFLAFFGPYRGHHHPHESPFVIVGPLVGLALLSVGGGWLSVPNWLAPMYPSAVPESLTLTLISSAAGLTGLLLATLFYVVRPGLAGSFQRALGPLPGIVQHKYFVDELYDAVIVKPMTLISRSILWKGVDTALIDGLVDGTGRRSRDVGGVLRQLQSGSIRNYATWIMAGSLIVILVLSMSGAGR